MYGNSVLCLLFIYISINLRFVRADECGIQNVNETWSYKSDLINDTFIGIIDVLKCQHVEDAYIDDSKYVTVSLEDDTLTIITTPEFAHYEEKEESTSLIVDIIIECDDEHLLTYEIPILDTNNHDPLFEQQHYNYVIYDKMPSTFDADLTDLQPIVGIDIDLSNEKVSFDIEENEYFSIAYGSKDPNSKKRHFAKLSAKKDIFGPFGNTFELTITDHGEPNRSSKAALTVIIINTAIPYFTESLYNAILTEDLDIVVENGPIALIDLPENVKISLSVESAEYFDFTFENDEINLFPLENISNLLYYNETYIIVKLEARIESSDMVAESSVLIDFSSLFDVEIPIEEVEINTETIFYSESSTETSTDFTDRSTDEHITTEEPEVTSSESGTETSMDFIEQTIILNGTTDESEETPKFVYVELEGFDSWISTSMGLNIMVVTLASLTVIIAIFYLKSKLNNYRRF